MMEGANLKIEDLVVNIYNFQCMIMRQMYEAMNHQSQALESIDKTLKLFVNVIDSEKVQEKVKNSSKTWKLGSPLSSTVSGLSGIAVTSTMSKLSPVGPPEYPENNQNADDPDWEGDEKTGKKFIAPTEFLLHRNNFNDHSKTEIYCHDCKATFIRGTGHFTRHLKFTSCRPYKCYCGKLFKKKSSLTAHKATHSTNVHKCKSCSSTFRCSQYLKNHIRRMHLVEPKRDAMTAGNVTNDKGEVADEHQDESFSEEKSSFHPLDLLKLQLE